MHKQHTNTMITIVFSKTEICLFNTENDVGINYVHIHINENRLIKVSAMLQLINMCTVFTQHLVFRWYDINTCYIGNQSLLPF